MHVYNKRGIVYVACSRDSDVEEENLVIWSYSFHPRRWYFLSQIPWPVHGDFQIRFHRVGEYLVVTGSPLSLGAQVLHLSTLEWQHVVQAEWLLSVLYEFVPNHSCIIGDVRYLMGCQRGIGIPASFDWLWQHHAPSYKGPDSVQVPFSFPQPFNEYGEGEVFGFEGGVWMVHSDSARIDIYATGARSWYTTMHSSGPLLCRGPHFCVTIDTGWWQAVWCFYRRDGRGHM